MILSTHIIIGASVAQLFPDQPVLAFTAAWASHYILDSIPHWDYNLQSAQVDENNKMTDMVINKNFAGDLAKIGLDLLIGSLIVFGLFYQISSGNSLIILSGILGGIFPDALQFVYFKFRHKPFVALKKFHNWCEAKTKIKTVWWGISSQILVAVIVIALAKLL